MNDYKNISKEKDRIIRKTKKGYNRVIRGLLYVLFGFASINYNLLGFVDKLLPTIGLVSPVINLTVLAIGGLSTVIGGAKIIKNNINFNKIVKEEKELFKDIVVSKKEELEAKEISKKQELEEMKRFIINEMNKQELERKDKVR